MMKKETRSMLHGVLLILLLAVAAFYLGAMPWCVSLSLSPMIVGILIGMLYANTLASEMPQEWASGVKFCSKRILRMGIILYGFRLTLADVGQVGGTAVLIDAIIVCGTIGLGLLLGRLLRMDKDLTLLTSCGSAICGAAAVLGAEGALRAKPYKTAVAVSTVVIFGTLAMFLYPALYRAGFFPLEPTQMGIYTGATVHEVAHVVGAGNAMGVEEASVSIIVKMIRVMMLVPVLLVLAWWGARQAKQHLQGTQGSQTLLYKTLREEKTVSDGSITVPWFAILFLLVIVFNSLVVLPAALVVFLQTLSTFFLTMAMTALGAETTIEKFRQAGARPFVLAFLLFVWLLAAGFFLVRWCV